MENKKHPEADIGKKRPALLLLGLIISLSLTFMAFEWKNYGTGELVDLGTIDDPFEEVIDIPITEIIPPKPIIKQPKIISIPDDEEIEEEIEIEIDVDITEEQVIEEIVMDDIEEEVAEDTFIAFPEENASFPGGKTAWGKFLKKNFKYPRIAQRQGIEGRVNLKFIVDKEGNISNIEVLRGLGGGCDEEAIRVLQKSPKWNPGRQRGRAVKSPMSIAIVFRLN